MQSMTKRLLTLYEERRLTGLCISEHPLAVLRPWLKARGFITARQMRLLPAGRPVALAGEVVLVHTPPMRNGKRVMFATLDDETGMIDLALFPARQPGNSKVLLANPLVLVRGTVSRRGRCDVMLLAHSVHPPPVPLKARKHAAPRGE